MSEIQSFQLDDVDGKHRRQELQNCFAHALSVASTAGCQSHISEACRKIGLLDFWCLGFLHETKSEALAAHPSKIFCPKKSGHAPVFQCVAEDPEVSTQT